MYGCVCVCACMCACGVCAHACKCASNCAKIRPVECFFDPPDEELAVESVPEGVPKRQEHSSMTCGGVSSVLWPNHSWSV